MNLQELIESNRIEYDVIAGSHSYGLNIATSDIDKRGIFMSDTTPSLDVRPTQVSDSSNDTTYYSLEQFFKLSMNASPNMIELLWIDHVHIQKCTERMQFLKDHRRSFLTTKCLHSFTGYAHSQIKKAKGQNKWINNPQPLCRPEAADYMHVVPSQRLGYTPETYACRPTKALGTKGMKLAKMEHGFNAYRMYRGEPEDDFFKSGMIETHSISKEDERLFIGLLSFNEALFKQDTLNHKHYWEWVENRNDSRWVAQEKGTIDYDAKNMMHCFRLIYSGISILETGTPIVKFTGGKREFLLDVRAGKLEYNELIANAEYQMERMRGLGKSTDLPPSVNRKFMNNLYQDILECGL